MLIQQVMEQLDPSVILGQIPDDPGHFPDREQYYQTLGRYQVLSMARTRLASMPTNLPRDLLQKKLIALLNWLVDRQVCWMSGQRRRRSSHELWKVWLVEGSLEQLTSVIRTLHDLLAPTWQSPVARHGLAFQVFHSRDLACSVEQAWKRWSGSMQEAWYQEVAIIRLRSAEDPLEDIFRLTNHIDQLWVRNREVIWSLDMYALALRLCKLGIFPQPECLGPSYPRSTDVGDCIVSVLSGTAWIVARSGFREIVPMEASSPLEQ